jgi:hypothetical protein
MGCDPVFLTLVPVANTIEKNGNNEVTGVCWSMQQKMYLDAENAPLQYGKKTYFYGKTYSGTLHIKLDYQSSVIFPGLVSEIDISNKSLREIYISGGQNYPQLNGVYNHVLDMNCAPYSTFWKHSTKNVILGKIPLSADNYNQCHFKAWTGYSTTTSLENPSSQEFSQHYWQGTSGAGNANNNKFHKYLLPYEIEFSQGVGFTPAENSLNLKINQNRFLTVKDGDFQEQIITTPNHFLSFKLGIEDIAAFEIDISALNLGQLSADISITHKENYVGQMHRFLQVGGIYYQDIDSIYGKRYAKRGSLDLSNQRPIWSLTGTPSNEVKQNFELMWYNHPSEVKFSPIDCQNSSSIDQNHPKYQPKVLNITNNFVKFDPTKLCGKSCPDGQSSCSLSLNWASSSSLSRSPNEDGNFNDPILDTPPPPSVYERIKPNPNFALPNENDALDNLVAPEPPTPPGNVECPFPFTCRSDRDPESSASTQCFFDAASLRRAVCRCNAPLLGVLRIQPRRSEGRAGTRKVLFIKKSSSSSDTFSSITKSNNVINNIINKNTLS